MDNDSKDESAVETSFSDIDSALTTYLGSDFCYIRREINGSITHILKKKKNEAWADQLTIDDSEVKGFDNEEIATFLIHKVLWDRRNQRTGGIIFLLMFIVGVPVIFILDLALGITDSYSLPGILVGGGVLLPFICLLGCASGPDEREVDNQVYSIRPNFIAVLRKMKEHEENEMKKGFIEERIQRLLDSSQTRSIE